MSSRTDVAALLARDVLDLHGVAALLDISRSSVNTLRVRRSARFPEPIYESAGSGRHPIRLWWRQDIVDWDAARKRA